MGGAQTPFRGREGFLVGPCVSPRRPGTSGPQAGARVDSDPGGARLRRPSGIAAQHVRPPRRSDPRGGCALRRCVSGAPLPARRPECAQTPRPRCERLRGLWPAVGVCAWLVQGGTVVLYSQTRELLGKSSRTLGAWGDTGWEGRRRPARENGGHLRVEPVCVLLRDRLKEAELDTSGEALQTPESPRN